MTVRGLPDLTPTEFENLIFDIMIARSMSNVTWRTPGADGGRDIEGNVIENDFSMSKAVQKWYVECKRYNASSVDWPTIYPKIAYADSNNADVLLVCASGTISPPAVTEVAKWNADRKRPSIRLWAGHQIESILSQHQDISWKYGLKNAPTPIAGSTLNITLALSKCVSSIFSSETVNDRPIAPMLRAAQSLAYLLQSQMENAQHLGRFKYNEYMPDQYDLPGCTIEPNGLGIDGPSLMAFLSYLQALRITLSALSKSPEGAVVSCREPISEIIIRYKSTLDSISLWGDFEYHIDSYDNKKIIFRKR